MCFYELFKQLGYEIDILAPHAESINLNEEFISLAKKRYKEENIIIVSDFDLAGVKFVQRCRQLNLNNYKFVSTNRIMINNKLKVLDKDISDYYENHGNEKSLKLIKSWKLI